MYGIAQSRAGRAKEAAFSLETALAIGVRRPGPVRGLLAKQYLALGDRAKAKQAAEQALKETPNNADAKQVLMRLGSAPGR
jgi:tetratricopeptide (TPR) repeat protein